MLAAAARQAGSDLHLALLTVEESGIAEYAGYGPKRGRWSEPELEAGEVDDRCVSLSEWRRLDGSPSLLVELPVENGELLPPDALEDMDPDEEHFHEATGNEGASFERTYRRAAFVLWPRAQFFAVLNQAGLAVTLPFLSDLTQRWTESGAGRSSPLWEHAHELSGHMVAKWATEAGYPRRDKAPSEAARMLTMLTLEDTQRIEALLAKIVTCGGYDKLDNDPIIGALATLSHEKRAGMIERVVAETAAMSLGACGELLGRAVAALADDRGGDFLGAAIRLVEALPGDPARSAVIDAGVRQTTSSPGPKPTTSMRSSSRRFEDWSGRARSAVRRRCSGCAPPALTTCAPALRNRWKRQKTGSGRARSPAAAVTASNSAVFSPTLSAGCGLSRPPKPNVVTSRARSPGLAATWI